MRINMKEKTNNERDFSLYNKILDYTNYINTYVAPNIPANRRDIRIHLLDEIYILTKNMFYATYTKGNIRNKYIVDMQVNISLIDMLTTQLRTISTIPTKHINSSISKLSTIKNLIYAWKFNEESKKD